MKRRSKLNVLLRKHQGVTKPLDHCEKIRLIEDIKECYVKYVEQRLQCQLFSDDKHLITKDRPAKYQNCHN